MTSGSPITLYVAGSMFIDAVAAGFEGSLGTPACR
jgi:hypothetical protein